jgi:hypothetical protein
VAVITLTVRAYCGNCDWTAGPSADWAGVERAAGKHLAPGHPVVTMAEPAHRTSTEEKQMTNAGLAALARQHARAAPRASGARRAWLVLSVCLATTSTVAGARRALRDIESPAVRQDAARLLTQLATKVEENIVEENVAVTIKPQD